MTDNKDDEIKVERLDFGLPSFLRTRSKPPYQVTKEDKEFLMRVLKMGRRLLGPNDGMDGEQP